MKNARTAALAALLQVEDSEGYSNIVIDKTIRQFGLEPRDAALTTAIFYGVLERRITLDYRIQQFSRLPLDKLSSEVLNALRIAVYQICYLEKIPHSAAVNEAVNSIKGTKSAKAAGYLNGVLRALLRGLDSISMPDPSQAPLEALSVEVSCPVWLIQLWINAYGQECALALVRSLAEKPPLFLRANTTRCSAQDLEKRFRQEGVEASLVDWLPGALALKDSGAVDQLPGFAQGLFHVQDLSSQLCCFLLSPKPGQTVADVCSAPGGKAFTMAEWMENQGKLLAFDKYKGKVGLIRQGAQRLGLSIIEAQMRDATRTDLEPLDADCVLCDAPCAGLGIIRRKPEIRYKKPKELEGLPELQRRILEQAARQVKSGGVLFYSTCSLNPAENGQVADWFLEAHGDFAAMPLALPKGMEHGIAEPDNQLTLFPHIHGTDGFFVAAFRKLAGSER